MLSPVTFELLGERLLAFVRLRIQNGEYSERGLARILRISQPQMHNVLKGARSLRPALADRLLKKFGITVLNLLTDAELSDVISTRSPDNPSIVALHARSTAGKTGVTVRAKAGARRWRKPATRSARRDSPPNEQVS